MKKLYRELLISKAALMAGCLFALLLPELMGTIVGTVTTFLRYGDTTDLICFYQVPGGMFVLLLIGILVRSEIVTLKKIGVTKTVIVEKMSEWKWHFWTMALIIVALYAFLFVGLFMYFCELNEFVTSSLLVNYEVNWHDYQSVQMLFVERLLAAFLLGACCISGGECDMLRDELIKSSVQNHEKTEKEAEA